jgi:hypothetical protein
VNATADPTPPGSGGSSATASGAAGNSSSMASTTGSGRGTTSTAGTGGSSPCMNGKQDVGEADVDCGGSCAPCNNGKHCAAQADCKSGFCADGFCCDTKCDGVCVACSAKNTGAMDGTCAPVSKGLDPDKECPLNKPETCGSIGKGCNGDATSPGCLVYDGMTNCAAASCAMGTQLAAAFCKNGACPQQTKIDCKGYACDSQGLACLGSCTYDPDCVKGYTCAAPKCIPFPTKICGGLNFATDNTQLTSGGGWRAFVVQYPVALTISRLEFFTGDTSGKAIVGIWSHDSAAKKPSKKLAEATFIQSATHGWQGATFSQPVLIPANTPFDVVWYHPDGGLIGNEAGGTIVGGNYSYDNGLTWSNQYTSLAGKFKIYCP